MIFHPEYQEWMNKTYPLLFSIICEIRKFVLFVINIIPARS
jgi:hypothetical protein